MRFVLGIIIAGLMVSSAVAQANSTNFKIQNGNIILAKNLCADCNDDNQMCRSRCNGSGTPCANACDETYRACAKKHCR
jgi:hypothetical protein